MSECWNAHPNDRPTFEQILENLEDILESPPPQFVHHRTVVRHITLATHANKEMSHMER